MDPKSMSVSVGGKTIQFETGKMAKLANGAVLVRCGETVVFATACMAKKASEDVDFIPLRIDYLEKFSSAGKTLGGFIKREGKPTERETLVCRLIDRPIRPMFEDGYYSETQILTYVLSYDGVHVPEPLAICAASAALVISDIPFKKPIASVRVGYIDGEYIINPTVEQMKISRLDLVLAGTEDAILMIEGYADFLTEEEILEAVNTGSEAIALICKELKEWQNVVGKSKKLDQLRQIPEDLLTEMEGLISAPLDQALRVVEKSSREEALDLISKQVIAHFFPENETPRYSKPNVQIAQKEIYSKVMRKMIFEENRRCDGRDQETVRPIHIETSVLPRTHGSALFTRGETQSLAVTTLGGPGMAQRYEDLQDEGQRHFYLQYFFPPFSVGEVGRMGPPGRREVGHGKLAERALSAAIPAQAEFPYTIRLESNILESNGSSSMASVCGGCLALMDAGVPIRKPIAGIAMGLVLEDERFALLSDILGIEDALGDMDFKVTGDETGVTAFQLDIKIEGITPHIMQVALAQAKEGRIHILNEMLKACPKPKEQLSSYAPAIETMQIKPSKIAIVIGPGGKQIRAIVEETGVEIDINDEGIVSISSTNRAGLEKAKQIIHNLTADVEVGKVYNGVVDSIAAFGLFVNIFNKTGLCHISEVSHTRINNLQDLYKEGDAIAVKVLEVNDRGQIKLSHKATLQREAEAEMANGQAK